jgi:hypothetical protein
MSQVTLHHNPMYLKADYRTGSGSHELVPFPESPTGSASPISRNRVQTDIVTRTYQFFTKFCATLATAGGILACFHPMLGLGVVLGAFSIFLVGTIFFLIAKWSKEGCKTALKSLIGMIFAPLYLIHSLLPNSKKETESPFLNINEETYCTYEQLREETGEYSPLPLES